jgi:hypothetical protein
MRKAHCMPSLVAMQYNPVIFEFSERLRRNRKNSEVIVYASCGSSSTSDIVHAVRHLLFFPVVAHAGEPPREDVPQP